MTDIKMVHRNHYTCGDFEVRGVVGDCSPGNGRLVRPAQPDEIPEVWGLYTTDTSDGLPMHVRDLPTLETAFESLVSAAAAKKCTVSQQEYVAKEGLICPFCRSKDVSGNSFDCMGNLVFLEMTCTKCSAGWDSAHRLTGWQPNRHSPKP